MTKSLKNHSASKISFPWNQLQEEGDGQVGKISAKLPKKFLWQANNVPSPYQWKPNPVALYLVS